MKRSVYWALIGLWIGQVLALAWGYPAVLALTVITAVAGAL